MPPLRGFFCWDAVFYRDFVPMGLKSKVAMPFNKLSLALDGKLWQNY